MLSDKQTCSQAPPSQARAFQVSATRRPKPLTPSRMRSRVAASRADMRARSPDPPPSDPAAGDAGPASPPPASSPAPAACSASR